MSYWPRQLSRIAVAVLLLGWAASAQAETVTVFAASSLKSVLDVLQPEFEKSSGTELRMVYAGSSVLARQIGQGAPADVFISANEDWMDVLEEQGAIASDSRVDLIGNRLVLVATQNGAPINISSLASLEGRIAMGLVDAVPAGIYGKQAFVHLGLWDALKPRVVQSDNVRSALALVARGEVAYGVVYASDAWAEARVYQRSTFEPQSHNPIKYPAALTSRAKANAAPYLQFLKSEAAQQSFVEHGFSLLERKP